LNEKIGIADIIDMMIRRWWIWAVCAVTFAVAAFIYTQIFVDPLYRTDGSLVVDAQKTQTADVTQGQMTSSQELVKLFKELLSSRSFLASVSEDMDGRYSAGELKGMISCSSKNETQVLEVRVTGKVPQDVQDICNSVLKRASEQLPDYMGGKVRLLDEAYKPGAPVSPNVKQNALIAFLLGVAAGAGIILLLELFDTRIKSRDDIVNKFPEPLLGEIPEFIQVEEAGAKR